MKKILTFLTLSLPSLLLAQSFDTRTDSVDVSKYQLIMDMRDMANKNVTGVTDITFSIKQFQVDTLRLDLLGMTVDSIVNLTGQTALPFRYTSKNIYIALDNTYKANSSSNQVRIYYHGTPGMDASAWGGFYFVSPYAWNLGVGFAADPHCYGRAWFPCMDNFTDRAEYVYFITVPKGYAATCGDCYTQFSTNTDSSRTYFSIGFQKETYPTYLASIAVAPYQMLTWQHSSNNQQVPVVIAAEAKDTSNVRTSFKNLDSCISGFMQSYGPYRFNKVGYSLVPFNSGAMEHVGNIAYPRYAADGTLAYEHLYAHELSHQWWGDNTTCRTPEDMWLNEGWASYSEALFVEKVYGKEAYKKYVADNHLDVLHYAHIRDSIYWPVSGVPHKYTYGNTVYKKGADMVHTLRGYMGDSAFFAACSGFQEQFKYSDVSSDDMAKYFQQFTQKDLGVFFRNWIYTAGFPHYTANISSNTSNFIQSEMYVSQTPSNNPLDSEWVEATFIGANFEEVTMEVNASSSFNLFYKQLPFNPTMVVVDRHEKLSDAVTQDILVVKPNQKYSLKYGMLDVNVPDGQGFDSALLVVQHHWVKPKFNFNGNIIQATRRYWTVQCNKKIDVPFVMSINYNGQKNMNGGYLDNDILPKSEDSIQLFCEKQSVWTIKPSVMTKGNLNDRKGRIDFEFDRSESTYTLGYYSSKIPFGIVKTLPSPATGLQFIPNPSNGRTLVQLSENLKDDALLKVFDSSGKEILVKPFPRNTKEMSLQLEKPGVYVVSIHTKSGQQIATDKLVIGR